MMANFHFHMSSLTPERSFMTPEKSAKPTSKDLVDQMLIEYPYKNCSNTFDYVDRLTLAQKNTILDAYPNADGSNRLLRNSIGSQDTWIATVVRKLLDGKDPYRQ